jgi:hypothetical protein
VGGNRVRFCNERKVVRVGPGVFDDNVEVRGTVIVDDNRLFWRRRRVDVACSKIHRRESCCHKVIDVSAIECDAEIEAAQEIRIDRRDFQRRALHAHRQRSKSNLNAARLTGREICLSCVRGDVEISSVGPTKNHVRNRNRVGRNVRNGGRHQSSQRVAGAMNAKGNRAREIDGQFRQRFEERHDVVSQVRFIGAEQRANILARG